MKNSPSSKTKQNKKDDLVEYIAENAIRDTLKHRGYSPAELFLHMYQGDIDSAGERVSGKERAREKVR
jgi:hypothetical protein